MLLQVVLIRSTDLAFSLYQRAFYDKKIDAFRKRDLCITAEKWFASGKSNVFRLSRDHVNGLP
jgi:hypothetical protein